MTDIEDDIKRLFEKDGFKTNVPIFNDNYNTIMSFDVARTLPENPIGESKQETAQVEENANE